MKRIMSYVIILTMLSGCGKIEEFLKPKKIVVYKTTVRQIDNVQIAATLGTAYLAYECLPLKEWYDETTKFFTQNTDKGDQMK